MRLQDSRHGRICLGRSATGKQVARALRRQRKSAGHRRVFHHEPQLFFGRKHRLGRLRLKYGVEHAQALVLGKPLERNREIEAAAGAPFRKVQGIGNPDDRRTQRFEEVVQASLLETIQHQVRFVNHDDTRFLFALPVGKHRRTDAVIHQALRARFHTASRFRIVGIDTHFPQREPGFLRNRLRKLGLSGTFHTVEQDVQRMLVIVVLDHIKSQRRIGISALQLRKRDRSRFSKAERLESRTVAVTVQVGLHFGGNVEIVVAQVQHTERAVLAQQTRNIVLIEARRTGKLAEHALRNVRRAEVAATAAKELPVRIDLQFLAVVQPHIHEHFGLGIVQAVGFLDLLHSLIDAVIFRDPSREHLQRILLEVLADDILHALVQERRHRRRFDIGDRLEQVSGHLFTGAQLDFLTVAADLP